MSSGYVLAAAIGEEYLNDRAELWNTTAQKLIGNSSDRKKSCEGFKNRILDFTKLASNVDKDKTTLWKVLAEIIVDLGIESRRVQEIKDSSMISSTANTITSFATKTANFTSGLFNSAPKSKEPEADSNNSSYSEALHAMRTILVREFKKEFSDTYKSEIERLKTKLAELDKQLIEEIDQESIKVEKTRTEKTNIFLNLLDLQDKSLRLRAAADETFPKSLPKDTAGTPNEHGKSKFNPRIPRVYHDDYWIYYLQTILNKKRQDKLKEANKELIKNSQSGNRPIDIDDFDLMKILPEENKSPSLSKTKAEEIA